MFTGCAPWSNCLVPTTSCTWRFRFRTSSETCFGTSVAKPAGAPILADRRQGEAPRNRSRHRLQDAVTRMCAVSCQNLRRSGSPRVNQDQPEAPVPWSGPSVLPQGESPGRIRRAQRSPERRGGEKWWPVPDRSQIRA